MPELNDSEKQNLADFAESVYKQYEDLPMAQQLGLAVAPGTGKLYQHMKLKNLLKKQKKHLKKVITIKSWTYNTKLYHVQKRC